MPRPSRIRSAAANLILGRLLLEMARKKFVGSRDLLEGVDALIALANRKVQTQAHDMANANLPEI